MIDINAYLSGGFQPKLSQKNLNLIPIPLPPLLEQAKIVDFLKDFENNELQLTGTYLNPEVEIKAVELHKTQEVGYNISSELTNQLDLLKKLRQQILQDAVQGKLVPQDPNDEPASKLLESIKAEKELLVREKKIKKGKPLPEIKPEEIPFEIPENWVWCRLGEIGICKTGTTPSTTIKNYFGSDIPFIKPADISLNGIHYKNEGLSFLGLKEGVHIPKGSLLMVCIGGSIGKSYFNEYDVSCNQQINTITPNGNIKATVIQSFLQSKYFQKAIWAKASGGTTPIVNRSKWESIPIPLPSISEQNRIVTKIEQLMTLCDELEQSIQQNQKYTQELLQVALKEALEPKN